MIYFTQKEREQVRREHAALAAVVLDAIEVTAALARGGGGSGSKEAGPERTRRRGHGPFAEGWQDAASAIVAGGPAVGGVEPSKPGRARRKYTRTTTQDVDEGGPTEPSGGIGGLDWRGTRDREVDACLSAFGRWYGARAAGVAETDCAIKLDAFELFGLPDLEQSEADPEPDADSDSPDSAEPRCAAPCPPATPPSSAPPG